MNDDKPRSINTIVEVARDCDKDIVVRRSNDNDEEWMSVGRTTLCYNAGLISLFET